MRISDLTKIFIKKPLDLNSVKAYLEKEKKELEDRISELKSEDPFMQEGRDLENEPITDGNEIEGHDRIKSIRDELKKNLARVNRALEKIGSGTYQKCDNCGKEIDISRLQAMPMATVCLHCERILETHLA